MSADNWAVCPRCKAEERKRIDQLKVEVDAAYGKLGLDAFDKLRSEYEHAIAEFIQWEDETKYATFREDYEIYGADEGTVVVSYSGHCNACNCGTDFKYEVPLNG